MSHPLELFRFCPVCGSNKFIENNNQSKRCETCGFIDYINPKAAVVAVITNTKGDILEPKIRQKGHWICPEDLQT